MKLENVVWKIVDILCLLQCVDEKILLLHYEYSIVIIRSVRGKRKR